MSRVNYIAVKLGEKHWQSDLPNSPGVGKTRIPVYTFSPSFKECLRKLSRWKTEGQKCKHPQWHEKLPQLLQPGGHRNSTSLILYIQEVPGPSAMFDASLLFSNVIALPSLMFSSLFSKSLLIGFLTSILSVRASHPARRISSENIHLMTTFSIAHNCYPQCPQGPDSHLFPVDIYIFIF